MGPLSSHPSRFLTDIDPVIVPLLADTVVAVGASTRTTRQRGGARAPADEPSAAGISAEPSAAETTFEIDTLPVIRKLSLALHALVRAIPATIDGPRDLERALEIDYILAWRVYTVAHAKDPGEAGVHIPRPRPLRRLLNAAEKKGLPEKITARVAREYARFEEVVRKHAGDDPKRGPGRKMGAGGRDVFNTLIGNVNGESNRTLDLATRRAAFKANACAWGIQSHTSLMLTVSYPGQGPDEIDSLLLSGYLGLHAVRRNVNFRLMMISAGYSVTGPSTADKQPRMLSGARLLKEFCSDPLPPLQTGPAAQGMREASLLFDKIGKTSAIDIFAATVTPNIYGSVPQPWIGATKGVGVPCEIMLVDMLVPKGWTKPASIRASTHGNVSMYEAVAPRIPEFELPTYEQAQHLGTNWRDLACPEMPRYPEILEHTLGELGWAEREFDVYRVQVKYPLMHTLIHLRADASSDMMRGAGELQ